MPGYAAVFLLYSLPSQQYVQSLHFSTPHASSISSSLFLILAFISAAAALGDAGSPASDTTLGPTSGLNADGQHDHIRDTCIPTFIAFNIPIMICAILMSQVL